MTERSFASIEDYVAFLEREELHRRRALGPPQNVGAANSSGNHKPGPRARGPRRSRALGLRSKTTYGFTRGVIFEGRCSIHLADDMRLRTNGGYERWVCRICETEYERARRRIKREIEREPMPIGPRSHPHKS